MGTRIDIEYSVEESRKNWNPMENYVCWNGNVKEANACCICDRISNFSYRWWFRITYTNRWLVCVRNLCCVSSVIHHSPTQTITKKRVCCYCSVNGSHDCMICGFFFAQHTFTVIDFSYRNEWWIFALTAQSCSEKVSNHKDLRKEVRAACFSPSFRHWHENDLMKEKWWKREMICTMELKEKFTYAHPSTVTFVRIVWIIFERVF